jgi:hypothetical protein
MLETIITLLSRIHLTSECNYESEKSLLPKWRDEPLSMFVYLQPGSVPFLAMLVLNVANHVA